MDDLYKLLGVRKNSKKQTIRKAYIQLSKKHHPDKGGDREIFEKIQFAWEVLRDDKLRKQYDETGEVPKSRDMHKYSEQDKTRGQVLIHAISCFQSVLHNNDPKRVDIIATCKKVMGKNIKEAQGIIDNCKKDIDLYDNVLDRLKCKTEDNPLRISIMQQKDVVIKAIKDQEDLLKILNQSILIFDNYEYTVDEMSTVIKSLYNQSVYAKINW